ncbi:ThiF family adenylyltransferase [Vibrio parahaemolyticus]|nr:ThiF family adenylyltransferase [Vibrio parahaemolyticus]
MLMFNLGSLYSHSDGITSITLDDVTVSFDDARRELLNLVGTRQPVSSHIISQEQAIELRELNFLVPHKAARFEQTRYQKLSDYIDSKFNYDAFDNIQKAKVLLVGCGGVGAEVALHLAAAGVSELVLVDFDTVALHNLNRQYLYREHMVGQPKVQQLALQLKDFNPSTTIYQKTMQIESDFPFENESDIPEVDLIVCAADSPPLAIARYLLTESLHSDTPIVFGGVGINHGNCGPLLISEDSKLEQLADTQQLLETLGEIGSVFSASYGPSNSITSGYISDLIIQFLAGEINEDQALRRIQF